LPQECYSAQAVKAKRGGARKPLVIDRLSVMGSLLLATLIDGTLVIAATPLGANEPLLQKAIAQTAIGRMPIVG
jgi:hypothetical protein